MSKETMSLCALDLARKARLIAGMTDDQQKWLAKEIFDLLLDAHNQSVALCADYIAGHGQVQVAEITEIACSIDKP